MRYRAGGHRLCSELRKSRSHANLACGYLVYWMGINMARKCPHPLANWWIYNHFRYSVYARRRYADKQETAQVKLGYGGGIYTGIVIQMG